MIHLVYVAGKFHDPNPNVIERNVAAAIEASALILIAGDGKWLPVCPHTLTHSMWLGPNKLGSREFWLEATLELMKRCDAAIFLPGWERSEGAQGEKEAAVQIGLPWMGLVRRQAPRAPDYKACLRYLEGQIEAKKEKKK